MNNLLDVEGNDEHALDSPVSSFSVSVSLDSSIQTPLYHFDLRPERLNDFC
jgi:hypothetical protein